MVQWQQGWKKFCQQVRSQVRTGRQQMNGGWSFWVPQQQRRFALVALALLLTGTIVACQPGSGKQPVEITLVSFAVTRSAYKTIIPKFVARWQQQHGQTVTIAQSYGASGAQARAVIDGLGADVVHLALGLDVDRIAQAGLLNSDWAQTTPQHGIVTRSVATLVTRAGNPKQIQTWADLVRPEVRLITADPKTSGVARWNFLALWNAAIQSGQDEARAQVFVTQAYRNAPVLSRDAREATDAFFKQGQGDVLINYENEVLLAASQGTQLPFTIPDVNISIDNPIAIVARNVDKHQNRAVATAFVNYLFSPEAQIEFAKAGFRPVEPSVARTQAFVEKYPAVAQLSTVADYGGWSQVQQKFFADGAMFDQIQTQLRSVSRSPRPRAQPSLRTVNAIHSREDRQVSIPTVTRGTARVP